jgi:hypothetical protein
MVKAFGKNAKKKVLYDAEDKEAAERTDPS